PGGLLLVFLPLVLVARWIAHGRPDGAGRAAGELAVWGGAALVAAVAAWPALWLDPLGTGLAVLRFAASESSTRESVTAFLGASTRDPGPLFYPLALLLRATPALCLGLALGGAAWLWRRGRAAGGAPGGEAEARLGLVLAVWALLFLAAMSVGSKKQDRYL